ncbi:nucleolar complex-associated protein 2-like [Silene latifolia]|uniref:nucleolar complex-associated protein 2-like n=1 Tax=Silene latifolia TaxID=37657 RepID=UPI003D76D88D
MGSKKKAKTIRNTDVLDDGDDVGNGKGPVTKKEAKEHKKQLELLKETQPEFYDYLKDVDKELLEFDDDAFDDDTDTGDHDAETGEDDSDAGEDDAETDEDKDLEDDEGGEHAISEGEEEEKPSKSIITMDMVNTWCNAIDKEGKIAPIRNLLKAFKTACHYADSDDTSTAKLSGMSNDVLNKIMVVTLCKMDRVLRKLMNLPSYGGKKEMVLNVKDTKPWKKYNHMIKSYLGNSLHALNRMTDAKEISFTLRRLKHSTLFMAAFPTLLRKFIKVAIHFWGTGGGALTAAAFLFLRDLCVRLGTDCLDECLKGSYKAYVMNCQYVNTTKLQHIHLLRQCFILLLSVDLSSAYQHGFVYIRQLATILREALSLKTKEAFRKVYEWKFISCLELWTGAMCEYGSDAEFKPLAYPLTQIIYGVTRLVPTSRYFPLRIRCIRMLNRIAAATNTFIPVSMLLLDMLEMKELHTPPTGGVGKAADLRIILKVSKPALKTRSFQEACVSSVIEELGEHLAQWSYSVAFFELSFIPGVRLRTFSKTTKVERFRKEIRELVRQIEATSEFTNESRAKFSMMPNDPAISSFLEDEKKSGKSPLSKYVAALRQRAQQRNDSLMESSVLYGKDSASFGKKPVNSDEEMDSDEENDAEGEGAAVFNSSWLLEKEARDKSPKEKKKKKKEKHQAKAVDEDIVEELILSSDEDEDEEERMDEEPMDESPPSKRDIKSKKGTPKKANKKEGSKDASSKRDRGNGKKGKGKKRKRSH